MQKARKVCVITGAASGIGLALAKLCAKKNMQICMIDINQENLNKALKEVSEINAQLTIKSEVCDVSDFNAFKVTAEKIFTHFERVDMLINNAGIIGPLAPFWELTQENIDQVLKINLHGVINGTQSFIPFLFNQPFRSRIVNMASLYGLCSGSHLAAYSMSKHAIVALSESLFFDFKRLNKPVDISVVCPSFASTSLIANSSPGSSKLQELVHELVLRSRPVEDIAEIILREIEQDRFYILPDKEVKNYCEARAQAILEQKEPHMHNLEKLIASLSKRAGTQETK